MIEMQRAGPREQLRGQGARHTPPVVSEIYTTGRSHSFQDCQVELPTRSETFFETIGRKKRRFRLGTCCQNAFRETVLGATGNRMLSGAHMVELPSGLEVACLRQASLRMPSILRFRRTG